MIKLMNFITSTRTLMYFRILNVKTLTLAWKFKEIPFIMVKDQTICRYIYVHIDEMFAHAVKIELGSKVKEEVDGAITALLHEIGHHMDISSDPRSHKSNTNSKEKRAWKNAIKLSNKYNISMNKDLAIKWLGGYKAKSAHLENL